MANLTADQAVQVSGVLQQLASSISAYVIDNQTNLAPDDKQQLMDIQGQIADKADGLLDYASDLVFEDVDQQLAQLNAINTGIAQKLKTLGNIQKVIEIAADVLSLTEAICTFNPGAIASSAGDIIGQLGITIG